MRDISNAMRKTAAAAKARAQSGPIFIRNFSNTKPCGEAAAALQAAGAARANTSTFSHRQPGVSGTAHEGTRAKPLQFSASRHGLCASAPPRLASLCAFLMLTPYREAPRLLQWMRLLGL